MEDLLIPGWAVYLIGVIVLWLVWLTLQTFQNQKSIAVNNAHDENVSGELEKIYKAIEKLEDKIDVYFTKKR